MPLDLLLYHSAGAYGAAIGRLLITLWIINGALLVIPIVDLIAWRWRWLGWVDIVVTVGAWGLNML